MNFCTTDRRAYREALRFMERNFVQFGDTLDVEDEVGLFAASTELDEKVGATSEQVRAGMAVQMDQRVGERSGGFVVKPLQGNSSFSVWMDA